VSRSLQELFSREFRELVKSDFEKKHTENKDGAIQKFKNKNKMGGLQSSTPFLEKVSFFFLK
jgi:hypothetical protein